MFNSIIWKKNIVQIRIGTKNVKCAKKDVHLCSILTNKAECVEDAIAEEIQQYQKRNKP